MKTLIILLLIAVSTLNAKEGLITMDFGYVRMRGRTHSDGLVILRNARKPVVCRMRKASDDERENAFVKWGEAVKDVFVIPVDDIGKAFLFFRENVEKDGTECRRGVAYILDYGGRWAKGVFSIRSLGWPENDVWGNYEFANMKDERK